MSDIEILQKAIVKAVKNGWSGGEGLMQFEDWILIVIEGENYVTTDPFIDLGYDTISTSAIIFSHTFAKAFFGEKDIITTGDPIEDFDAFFVDDLKYEELHTPAWQYHLQRMVLEEHPIEYLEAFL